MRFDPDYSQLSFLFFLYPTFFFRCPGESYERPSPIVLPTFPCFSLNAFPLDFLFVEHGGRTPPDFFSFPFLFTSVRISFDEPEDSSLVLTFLFSFLPGCVINVDPTDPLRGKVVSCFSDFSFFKTHPWHASLSPLHLISLLGPPKNKE